MTGLARTFGRSRRGSAFTLTELLIAIALVGFLTIGVGQIFTTLSEVVKVGSSIAKIDQVARAVERQLRSDIQGLNEMSADETFIVIRMREVGDVNRNAQLDTEEIALYLSPEDRDADIRNGIRPYAQDSRAVTRRLDELMFIAAGPNGGNFRTFQIDRLKPGADPIDITPIPGFEAPFARIIYGHALRPAPDLEWPPALTDAVALERGPIRQYVPDGDFGQRAGETNRFGQSSMSAATSTGRNEYAGEFILGRQALLLPGESGLVAGHPPNSGRMIAPIGNSREFTPYIRDDQSLARWPIAFEALNEIENEADVVNDLFVEEFPEARLIGWGRVDICAQSRQDVQRWLEGAEGDDTWTLGSTPPSEGFAFSSGIMTLESETGQMGQSFTEINGPLWQREDNGALTSYEENLARLRSAIAGCLARPLVEDAPPPINREPVNEFVNQQPQDAVMDLHATLAPRCNNFEIAWSDGSTSLRSLDLNGDGVFEVREGDLVWYDISPLIEGEPNPPRSTFNWWVQRADSNSNEVSVSEPDTTQTPGDLSPFPEIHYFNSPGQTFNPPPDQRLDRNTNEDVEFANNPWTYLPYATRGANANAGEPEYLAIWGFRVPTASGGYGGAWSKDILLRIRMTINDPSGHLGQGRQFEYIFRVNPGRADG